MKRKVFFVFLLGCILITGLSGLAFYLRKQSNNEVNTDVRGIPAFYPGVQWEKTKPAEFSKTVSNGTHGGLPSEWILIPAYRTESTLLKVYPKVVPVSPNAADCGFWCNWFLKVQFFLFGSATLNGSDRMWIRGKLINDFYDYYQKELTKRGWTEKKSFDVRPYEASNDFVSYEQREHYFVVGFYLPTKEGGTGAPEDIPGTRLFVEHNSF